MRIALIADSHVSPRTPECVQNWHAAARAVSGLAVDLTVHLGDITLNGESHPQEIDFAAELIEDWPTPIRCVPGNHDIGTGCGEEPLSTEMLSRYTRALGTDRWLIRDRAWAVFGVNAQLFGSNTKAETAQWDWLEREAAALAPLQRAVLLLHRPLVRAPSDDGMPTGRYVAVDAAQRLLQGPLRRALKLVASGHTHQALDFTGDELRHLWVPSTGFVINDERQARIGEKVVGVGLLTLESDEASYQLVRVLAMKRHELTSLACFAELTTHR